jgi:peptide/nickel transport system permease protein
VTAGAPAAATEGAPLAARGSLELVWARFRRDRLAVVAGCVLLLVLLACFVVEPILGWLLGRGPDDIFPYASVQTVHGPRPVGPWSWVPDTSIAVDGDPATVGKTFFLLGADSPLGRDELLRLLAGGRVSIEIALGAAALAVVVGALLGAAAGYFGGMADAAISRLTELVMAFPLLLLLIAVGQTVADRFDFVTLHGAFKPGVLSLALVIGAFTWFYPARIVRAEVLSLRTREFVDAARVAGAGEWRILRTHMLPHLAAPLAVWGTLIVASNVILEAAISFLNLGVRLPTASWGNMLSQNWGTLLAFDQGIDATQKTDWTQAFPTAAVFVTVLSLALVGEGLRRAIDPGSEA